MLWSHLSGAIQGGLRPWAMDGILRAKQCVVIGKGKGRHAERMVRFQRRAEEVAALEVDEDIGDEQRAQLGAEMRDMLRGSFRPTLIPHPLMRVHGRVWLQSVKPDTEAVLGGIGYGACIMGGAGAVIIYR